MWDIEVSPADNNKIYVTGSVSSGLSQIPLFYSQNNGATWDTLSTTATISHPFINCLAVKNIPSGDKVFLGGNGVYVYENNFTGINELVLKTSTIVFPNPFSSSTILHADNIFKNLTLTIHNSIGQQVKQLNNVSGQTVTLYRENLPSGLYILRLTQDNKLIYINKLIIID
jgi:hypothetical protein